MLSILVQPADPDQSPCGDKVTAAVIALKDNEVAGPIFAEVGSAFFERASRRASQEAL
jgi:hypothetical protein